MLHGEDSAMIMQDESNPHSLYKMDLEYGKVVDEWRVHDDIPINLFTPENVGFLGPSFGGLGAIITKGITEICTNDERANLSWIVPQCSVPS